MLNPFIRLVPFGLTLTIVGCAEKPEHESAAPSCYTDTQCSGDQVCVDRICVVEAEDSEEGEEGEDGSAFVAPGDSEGGESGEDETGPVEDSGPTSCTDGFSCQGDDAIAVCASGEEVVFDCATVCSEGGLGAPLGCGFSAESGHDACFCEEVCADPGESCTVNGDCCDFGDSSAGCVNFPSGSVCSDKCAENSGCISDCCQPLQANGVPVGYGACSAPDLCVQGDCGYSFCEYAWCGTATANDCPVSYFGDGSCDCGCQFFDIDCQ